LNNSYENNLKSMLQCKHGLRDIIRCVCCMLDSKTRVGLHFFV